MKTTTDAAFAATLDYLPIAVRAAERNPHDDILWAESIRAQRAVIDYADAQLPEYWAARVQAAVNSIASHATLRDDLAVTRGAYGEECMAERSERSKRHILTLMASR
jgi:hypothetical protein